MKQREYTDDRIPITDEADYPGADSDYTEETDDQLVEDILEIIDEEQGIVSENTLLEEGVVFEDDIGRENMENDFQDSAY